MKISEIKPDQITDELMDRVLYAGLEYQNQHLDVAIVLGSTKAHVYRIPYAVEVYHRGLIDKIIVAGGVTLENGQTEAELMKQTAIGLGVDEEDILIENKSSFTWQNMVFSRKIMQERKLLHPGINIGIVTTAFHMRRSLLDAARAFEDDDIHLIPLPGQDHSSRRDTWQQTEKGRKIVTDEFLRLLEYTKNGYIDDLEI